MIGLLRRLFGCRHQRRTWPLSRVCGRAVEPYQVCLECGRELLYGGLKRPQEGVSKPVLRSATLQSQTKDLE